MARKAGTTPSFPGLLVGTSASLDGALRKPLAVFGLSGGVVVAAFALVGALGIEFLPTLDEGVIWIRAVLPPGISLDESARMAGQIRNIVSQYPEVQLVSSQTGRNDSGTDPYGPNRNEFFVALKPYDIWPAGMNKAGLITQLSRKLNEQIPGTAFSFTQPIIDNVTEAVTGSAADLAVILRGPDLGVLREQARQSSCDHPAGAWRGRHRDRAGRRSGATAHPYRPAGGGALTASTSAMCRT